jgi:tRNA threonylcarbamoyladenosine biosynthesis protein TsaB
MLLAIDTATSIVSIALHDHTRLLAESTWYSPNNHTIELAPSVQAMLVRARIGIDGLSALAVVTGPGSYSALRIGVSFAKAVAAARRLPLVGMSTLDVLALAQHAYPGDLIAVAGAGRTRVIAARYQWHDNRWSAPEAPQNWDWNALIDSIRTEGKRTWVTGEIDAEAVALIDAARAAGVNVYVAFSADRLRRAGFLAAAAVRMLRQSGEQARIEFDPARVAPTYINPV